MAKIIRFMKLKDGQINKSAKAALGLYDEANKNIQTLMFEDVETLLGAHEKANPKQTTRWLQENGSGAEAIKLSEVQILSPIKRPLSIRDGYAFRAHVETARKGRGLEMPPEYDQFPVFYFSNTTAVTGPGPVQVEAAHLNRLDYELEVAAVIGSAGKNMSAKDAAKKVFGLMIMNDWSARAMQQSEMKLNLGPAKGKDFATSFGPYLVTMDELEKQLTWSERGFVFDAKMQASVNKKHLSKGNCKEMQWTFGEIISRASYGVELLPGEVIGSGTVGTGCLLELNISGTVKDLWLKGGDEVVLEVDGLGTLVNKVSVGL